MSHSTPPIPWKHIAKMLGRFAPLWIGCGLLMASVGVGLAVVRTPRYSASQPLLIRDEANGAADRLGRFASQSELKAAQETILEMAKSPEVVAAALERIGPPPSFKGSTWPTSETIDAYIEYRIAVRPPKGAEFGTTEVIYLETADAGRERAEALCAALFDELAARMRTLRKIRADSIINELADARELAVEKLESATRRLQTIESAVGGDLAELRSMTETIGGDGSARRSLVEVQTELQKAELDLNALQQVESLLESGLRDPERLLVAGDQLLSSQPTLKRLKDGLIDAQLEVSRLQGRFNEDHPSMKSARTTEFEIRQRLQQEINAALASMEPTLNIAEQRVERLRSKQTELAGRLEKLASIRADYSMLVSEVRQRTEVLGSAERALAEAEASRQAALSTSLVSKLGPPKAGDDPEGPSGTTLAVTALFSGLVMGVGLVFLVAPTPSGPGYGRRWSDYVGGRRASDTAGAAAANLPNSATPAGPAIAPAATGPANQPRPLRFEIDEAAQLSAAGPQVDREHRDERAGRPSGTPAEASAQPERRRTPRQEPSSLFHPLDEARR